MGVRDPRIRASSLLPSRRSARHTGRDNASVAGGSPKHSAKARWIRSRRTSSTSSAPISGVSAKHSNEDSPPKKPTGNMHPEQKNRELLLKPTTSVAVKHYCHLEGPAFGWPSIQLRNGSRQK